ncbi:MAG: hypothetical protein HKL91_03705 [Candidatus Eremiobacteraeota bacterium]|uniref:Uncharacterized protein n=1 Tax=mine drainage metagenome TaxID=410659 RepID=E6PEH1_9ZZZZ|nr:hypothetical protein [Candidatus Eremiobacteraeota bacterium]
MPIAQDALNHLLRTTSELRQRASPGGYGGAKNIPFVKVRGSGENSSGGFADARYVVSGAMGSDSRRVLAVPLMSGGSGGDFTLLLYAADENGSLRYAGRVDWGGGHIGVTISFASIVVTEPIYAAKDANCCPSAYLIELYQIRKGKLVRVGSANVPTPG